MTREEILAMKPGEELDRLVATNVFGEPEPPLASVEDAIMAELSSGPRTHSEKGCYILGTTGYDAGDEPKWSPCPFSTEIYYAWKVANRVSELVCPFENTDGDFTVLRMDWGDHNRGPGENECSLSHSDGWHKDDDRHDPEPWSAHFHIGAPAVGDKDINLDPVPIHWKIGDRFCAYGATPMEAICKAALIAMTPLA